MAFRSRLTMAAFVHVRPWPSYRDVQYVLFEYLPTFAFDGGVGVTFSDFGDDWVRLGIEWHRGDSEKVYLAYRVVDDRHLTLDEVFTSAHDDGTMHNGRWDASVSTDNTGNVTVLDAGDVTRTVETEQMSGSLEFDASGRLLVYPSRNKHAMYPSKSTCEAVTLVKLRVSATLWNPFSWYATGTELLGGKVEVPFTETCGYDPILSRTYDDARYLGNGRWRLDVFNVGEPGNWVVDSLWSPTGWRGLTADQVAKLSNRFPNESVWTGHLGSDPTLFCGGLDTTMGDYTYPEDCSGRLGAKYDEPPKALLDHLGSQGG